MIRGRMSLAPLPITDTRDLFRPVSRELLTLLSGLTAEDWLQPTRAGSWSVRDVVAHLVDGALRRLSFHRDALKPPSAALIRSERDLVVFINELNRDWVQVSARLSPRVLTDLYSLASNQLADFFESLSLDAPALFGVSWAGEETSAGWFDIGRDFTELWHHQMQIRMAVGAAPLEDPRYLRAVLEIAVRGLPHAFRDAPGERGDAVLLEVSGSAGGVWTLKHDGVWQIWTGRDASPRLRVQVSDDTLARLLFHALTPQEAMPLMGVEGDHALLPALIAARSVIV